MEWGSIKIRKDGKTIIVDEDATAREIKRILNLPPDSVLINARNEAIRDDERIGDKVHDGESVGAIPSYVKW